MYGNGRSVLRAILASLMSLLLVFSSIGSSTLAVFAEDAKPKEDAPIQEEAIPEEISPEEEAAPQEDASSIEEATPQTDESKTAPESEPSDEEAENAEKAEESGASIHGENGLYEVRVFGAPTENVNDAAQAIVDASKENPEESTVPLSEAKAMSSGMFRTLAATTPNSTYSYPRRLDGSDIESISIRWITKDTVENNDEDLLYLEPAEDSAFSVRFQIDYALSGEHNYEPGDIQIRIPAQVFHRRNSDTTSENDKMTGSMVIPLTQSPGTKTDFNWTLIDGEYVLTNTKNIVAATKGFIQFEIKGLIPHDIVDMSYTDDLQATIEVTTHLGHIIGLQSQKIRAQVNTNQKIVRANKDVSDVNVVEASEVGAIPANIRSKYPDDIYFLVVNWYVNAYHTGNQPYTITGFDTRTDVATGNTTTKLHDGWIIDGTSATTKDLGVVQEGWFSAGTTPSSSVKVAYPISQFEKDTVYTFTNHVEYDLVPLDGIDEPTHVEANGTTNWSYRDPVWIDPVGHFNVFKWGNDNDYGGRSGGKLTTHGAYDTADDIPRTSGTNTVPQHLQGWYGLYKKALNEMRDGEDYEICYTIKTDGYMLPWTYQGDTRLESSYGKRPVTMVTEDTGLWVGSQKTHTFDLVPGDNMDFSSIQFIKPIIGKIKAINVNPDGSFVTGVISTSGNTASDGTFDYQGDYDNSHIPPIILEVQRNGKWEEYASADWTTGSCVITLKDGTVVKGSKIDFPEGTENFRTKVTTGNASLVYCVRPSIVLHNTTQWRQHIEKLFETYVAPDESVWNGVKLNAYTYEGEEIVELEKNGYDRLRGYTTDIAVIPYKTGTIQSIDYDEQQVTLSYSARVEERSVIPDLDLYENAIEEGLIQPEIAGTWYDLLPIGVNPVMDTIKLRDSDTIKNAYTIPNYNGSGRTLLVVEAELTPYPQTYYNEALTFYEDVPSISFDATCDINYIIDYGHITEPDDKFAADLHNVIAFESSNDNLGDIEGYEAENNNPWGTNNVRTREAWSPNPEDAEIEKNAFAGLNEGRNTKSFLYAGVNNHVEILNAASTSLLKTVSVNNDGYWSQGTYYGEREKNARDVYEGGMYSYRVNMMSNAFTQTRDMILYDSLENYVAIQGNDDEDVEAIAAGKRWRGTLRSVDISQLRSKGINAIVYYSTIPELKMQEVDSPLGGHIHETNCNLNDKNIWTRADQYTGDLADVHAIAIDCRKGLDGKDFILEPEESVTVFINMWAPQGEEASEYIKQDAHAYNNIFLDCVSMDARTGGVGDKLFVRQDYVKVGLVENNITVHKAWDDDEDRDGLRPEEITLTLYRDGKVFVPVPTDNPNAYAIQNPVTVKLDKNGDVNYTFKHVPYCDDNGKVFNYSVKESEVKGYTSYVSRSEDGKTITLTNKHIPETTNVGGTKTWIGDNEKVRPAAIRVNLFADGEKVRSELVRADADGFWEYSFDNLPKYKHKRKEIVYTVEEQTVEETSNSYVVELDGYNIINTYHPFGDVEFTKTVNDGTSTTAAQSFKFDVGITTVENIPVFDEYDYQILFGKIVVSSGKVKTGDSISLKNKQKIKIFELPQGHRVTFTEVVPQGYTVMGGEERIINVRPNVTSKGEKINIYRTEGSVNLRATKTLENATQRNNQFRFILSTDEEGQDILAMAFSRADGSVTFGSIMYDNDDANKVHTYYIRELDLKRPGYTYDSNVFKADVNVVDLGDGTMEATPVYYEKQGDSWVELKEKLPEFKNEYHAEGELELIAWKVLEKREIEDGEFTFELLDSNDAVIATISNDENGIVKFDPIKFNETAIGKEYDYRIREVKGKDKTVIYSQELYSVHVKVSDNGDGTLSFEQSVVDGNNREAIPVFTNDLEDGSLAVEKLVEDNTYGEFKFKIKFTGPNVPEDGKYSFDKEQIQSSNSGDSNQTEDQGTESGDDQNEDKSSSEESQSNEQSNEENNEQNEDDKNPDDNLITSFMDTFKPFTAYAEEVEWKTYTQMESRFQYYMTEDGVLHIAPIDGEEKAILHENTFRWPWTENSDLKERLKKVVNDGKVEFRGGQYLFRECENLEDISALAEWDTENLTTLNSSFFRCYAIKDISPVKEWNVSQVREFNGLFAFIDSVENLDCLKDWDMTNAVTISSMFSNCKNLTDISALSGWDVSNVEDMSQLFWSCQSLANVDALTNWNVSKVKTLQSLFQHCYELESIEPLRNWVTSSLEVTQSMLGQCKKLTDVSPIYNWDTSKVFSLYGMFYGCEGLTEIDLSNWDTSRFGIKNDNLSGYAEISNMFSGCTNLERLNLYSFDTSNFTKTYTNDMYRTFGDCPKLSSVTLGPKWTIWYVRDMYALLPTPPPGTTGRWIREEGGVAAQTPFGLAYNYPSNAAEWQGTWVWEHKYYTIKKYASTEDTIPYEEEKDIRGIDLTDGVLPKCELEDGIFKGWSIKHNNYDYEGVYAEGTPLSEIMSNGPSLLSNLHNAYNEDAKVLHLYANYLEGYTLKFDGGDGGAGAMTPIQDCRFDSQQEIPESTFYRFNHHIKEWKGSNGETYAVGGTIPANSVKVAELTLTAVWEKDDNSVDLKNGEFEFTLASNERAIFSDLPAGVAYEVWEETPSGWVLVKSEGTAGEIESLKTAVAKFTNEYNPNEASVQIKATKMLDEKLAKNGAFVFELLEEGKVIQTISNTSGGGIVFDIIKYTRNDVGTHTYTIREVAGKDKTITYDSHEEIVTVVVEDDNEGNLTAKATYDEDGASFVNTTATGSLRLRKTVTGINPPRNVEFTFVVTINAYGEFPYTGSKKGTIRSGGTITLKAGQSVTITGLPDGTTYDITEIAIPTDFALSKKFGGSGKIQADKTATATFVNNYETDLGPASINLEARKVLEKGNLSEGQFGFLLKDSKGDVIDIAYNDASGKVRFSLIEMEEAGTYTYVISEEIPAGAKDNGDGTFTYDGIVYDGEPKNVTVTVEPDPDKPGQLKATPSYNSEDESTLPTFINKPAGTEILLIKSIDGDRETTPDKEFTFTVHFADEKGEELPGEFNWTLFKDTEYPTDAKKRKEATVAKGKVASGGQIKVRAYQALVIEDLPVGTHFEFEELPLPGFELVQTSNESGVVKNPAGLGKGSNTVGFMNRYSSSGEYTIRAKKALVGRKLTEGQFTFALWDEEGNIIARGTNDAKGIITFSKIPYTGDDAGKTFRYRITEDNAEDPGYTYDDTILEVAVTVKDNEDGTLSFSAAYARDLDTLNNEYEAEGEYKFKAQKKLTGRKLTEGVFNFEVVNEDGEVVSTGTNNAKGLIEFQPINFTQEDVGKSFTYEIREVIPEDADEETGTFKGITYDGHMETVTVNIEDTGLGTLNITATYDEDGAIFENEYHAQGEVVLEGKKTLDGKAPGEKAFNFVLKNSRGRVVSRAQSDEEGTTVFSPIAYTEKNAGRTYTYTISEVDSGDAYIKYDLHEEVVSVKVTDNGDGTLSCDITYDEDGVHFNNEEFVKLDGTKTWADRNNRDGIRPEAIKIQLLANGKPVEGMALTVTEEDGWAWSFDNLPKCDNNVVIKYTVSEEAVPGYTTKVKGMDVTNTHITSKTNIHVEKVWVDAEDKDRIRPESIKVRLLANGKATGKTAVLSEENNWEYTFENLYENAAGTKIAYTVEEVKTAVITGTDGPGTYAISVDGNAVDGYTITNTHTPEPSKVDVNGTKTWDDVDDRYGKRPQFITIRLYADGVEIDHKEVTEEDDWSWTFSGLPEEKDGKKIEYTISEDPVEYYYTTIQGDAANGYIVKNVNRPWIPEFPSSAGGRFIIKKTVSGDADKDKEYKIVVTFTKVDGTTWTETILLKPDTPYEYEYIPIGTVVEFSEDETGYQMTCTIDGKSSNSIEFGKEDTDVQVVINNHVEPPETPEKTPEEPQKTPEEPKKTPDKTPKTGDETPAEMYLAMVLLTSALVGAISYRRKLKR